MPVAWRVWRCDLTVANRMFRPFHGCIALKQTALVPRFVGSDLGSEVCAFLDLRWAVLHNELYQKETGHHVYKCLCQNAWGHPVGTHTHMKFDETNAETILHHRSSLWTMIVMIYNDSRDHLDKYANHNMHNSHVRGTPKQLSSSLHPPAAQRAPCFPCKTLDVIDIWQVFNTAMKINVLSAMHHRVIVATPFLSLLLKSCWWVIILVAMCSQHCLNKSWEQL